MLWGGCRHAGSDPSVGLRNESSSTELKRVIALAERTKPLTGGDRSVGLLHEPTSTELKHVIVTKLTKPLTGCDRSVGLCHEPHLHV